MRKPQPGTPDVTPLRNAPPRSRRHGSQWSVGTGRGTRDLETGYLLAQTLNGRLGLDAAACQMFAEQVMAANPTGRHPQSRPFSPD